MSAPPENTRPAAPDARAETAGLRFWILTALGVLVAASVAYRSLPSNWFVRDDFMWLHDAGLQVADPLLFLTWRPSGYFRPLCNLFFGAEYAIFGLEPAGYFRTHIALHAWNAFWIARLAWLLFGTRASALAAGLVFAAMQRPSGAVLWISGLVTLMAAGAILPTVACHIEYLRRGGRARYVGILLGVLACVMAKESGVIVGPLMILVELRERGWRGFLRRSTWLRYAPFLVLAALYAWVQSDFAQGGATSRMNLGFLEGAGNTLRAMVANYFLSFNTSQAATPGLRDVGYGLAAGGAVLLLGLALGGRRSLQDALVAHAFAFFGYLPFFVFLANTDTLTGRYSYLSCVGAALALGLVFGLLWQRLEHRLGRLALALPAVALAVYLGLLIVGVDRYARTNYRYHEQGEASRRLVAGVLREVEQGEADRLVLVGAPVENLRHLQCIAAVFAGLPLEAVDERRFELAEADVAAELEARGADFLVDESGRSRGFVGANEVLVLLWVDDDGLRRYRPERDPRGGKLRAGLERNWRDPTRPSKTARIQTIDL